MSPIRIDANHFSPDTRAFFACLAAERVRYVVLGGEAVIAGDGDGIPIRFIGLDTLVQKKRASGRPKDLDDLSYLGAMD